MKFVFFHLMPYPYLPDDFDEKYSSPSLTFPNSISTARSGTGCTTATWMSWSTPSASGSTGSPSTSTTSRPTG
jgi:hypothetical protein